MSAAGVIRLEDCFDDRDELRIQEHENGWTGFRIDEDHYYFVDTRKDPTDWTREVVVGEKAVREAVERYVRGDSR